MKWLCWLFGHPWRFAYKAPEDGVVREGYRQIDVMCERCGETCERLMAYIGADGEIYEDEEHARQEGATADDRRLD